jgi:hypothetical protein
MKIRNPKSEIRKQSAARMPEAACALPGSLRHSVRGIRPGRGAAHSESGMVATMLFIILLFIMIIFAMVESQALIQLHQQVRQLEHQQLKRLNGPQTNSVPAKIVDPR